MLRLATTVTLVWVGAMGPAMAQDSPHISPEYRACQSRAGSSLVQLSLCDTRELAVQDDRLNKAYQQVMHQLSSDPVAKATLREDERRWIRQRDYECRINGGVVDDACTVNRTATRADQLESRVRF